MLSKILEEAIAKNVSDVHLISGYPPFLRVNGNLIVSEIKEVLSSMTIENMVKEITTDEQFSTLSKTKELDLSYTFRKTRFRVNVYVTQKSMAISLRLIPKKIKTLEELMLPSSLRKIVEYKFGLVLVTGQTGQGKSTTLASLINEINLKYSKHIITIEDPIEYVYSKGGHSIISQRELGTDTLSWKNALRAVLREDPNVVLVGEMRDFDTIQTVLTIAETGHLVFSTLHTSSAPETISRIIDIFSPNQQNQIRTQLSSVLRVIISQRLVPKANNLGRIPALEILFNTSSISSLIRDGKTYMIKNTLQTAEEKGMIIFEKYLLKLYQQGFITRDTALSYALRPELIRKLI